MTDQLIRKLAHSIELLRSNPTINPDEYTGIQGEAVRGLLHLASVPSLNTEGTPVQPLADWTDEDLSEFVYEVITSTTPRIGLIDVDGHNGYPNLAIMKLSAYHKAQGHNVEWAKPGSHYDIIYISKVFSFTPDIDITRYRANKFIKGGTGYHIYDPLPEHIEHLVPDYDLYDLPKDIAYGFLTRGCPNKCYWCVVPKKEGKIHPHTDVSEIAVNGRNKLVLMDNNVLASPHGIEQMRKMVNMDVWVDFNQGLDARLVTPEIAQLLSDLKWIKQIRFGCDTPKQVEECNRAVDLIRSLGSRKNFLFYTMLHGEIDECYNRLMFWHLKGSTYNVQAQPYINLEASEHKPPKWQKDMAHWANKKMCFHSCDFKDFEVRKGFRGIEYWNYPELREYTDTKELMERWHQLKNN